MNKFTNETFLDRSNCWIPILILIIIAVLIVFIYSLLLKYSKYNTSKTEGIVAKILYFNSKWEDVFWQMTHFVLFFILGFFFPSCDIVIIALGVIWELLESALGQFMPRIFRSTQFKSCRSGDLEKYQWWHGSAIDIMIDIIGFYIGKSFRLLFWNPYNPPNYDLITVYH